MTRKSKLLIALLVGALVLVGLFFPVHLLGDSVQDGVLMWNSEEAYLFLGWGRSGYRLTGFEYLLSYIPAYFGVPRTVDDNRLSMIVIRIDPTGVQRYVAEPYQMDHPFLAYVPRGKTIYASDGGAVLWTWAGTHFEKLSPEEQQKLAVDQTVFSPGEDYTNVSGWSSRHSVASWPSEFKIELQGKPVTFLTKQKSSGKELSIELRLPSGASQMALHVKRDLHVVSKSEYGRAFGTGD